MTVLDPDVRRTMIAALVPDADALVGPFRERLDPTARRGLGAHVTLVYPFLEPAAVTDAAVGTLRDAVAPVAPFTCRFGAVRWFGRRVLWLAPEPVAPFREIADRVRHAVPEVPPEDRELVPHLTVGLRRAAPAGALEAAAEALSPSLPLEVRIDRVHVMARSATWDVAAEAPLRG
ncbi:2'-5' RNA ligase family protein [Actinomycetospora cinnamomea]|uniref:2'-5' RNA ligase n=1 Tax=Actinomycetospora cinnamomea TaxID=663609 RepID=A0A2U1EU69_9PSEU|nr:2'-5' RNA ligase family protein [Actinomycetospora cinnamomea]PVZ03475.1 2'-5' RNA ligase [Actinomycetospora cinnamomea]